MHEKTTNQTVKLLDVYAVYHYAANPTSKLFRWFFDTEATAREFITTQGLVGKNATVRPRAAIQLGDHVYLLEKTEPIFINTGCDTQTVQRRVALAKLTEAERKLLGLTEP